VVLAGFDRHLAKGWGFCKATEINLLDFLRVTGFV
jgi:hypothetical protein